MLGGRFIFSPDPLLLLLGLEEDSSLLSDEGLGRLWMFSVLDDTKMGELPPVGNLGTGGLLAVVDEVVASFSSLDATLLLLSSFLLLDRSC